MYSGSQARGARQLESKVEVGSGAHMGSSDQERSLPHYQVTDSLLEDRSSCPQSRGIIDMKTLQPGAGRSPSWSLTPSLWLECQPSPETALMTEARHLASAW